MLEGRKRRPERDSYQPEQVDACQHGLYRGRPDRDLVRPGMERHSPGWERSAHPVGQQEKHPEQKAVARDVLPAARARAIGAHNAQPQHHMADRLAARDNGDGHEGDERGDQRTSQHGESLACSRRSSRHHDAIQPKHDSGGSHIDSKREQATRERGVRRAARNGPLVHIAQVGQEVAERNGGPEPKHGAERVGDEVVDVEQPVRMLVDAEKPRDLRYLEEQGEREPQHERLPPAAMKQIAQVDTERYGKQHVEIHRVDVGAAQERDPRRRRCWVERRPGFEGAHEAERNELRVLRPRYHDAAVRRKRQDDHEVRAHEVEDEREDEEGLP